MRVSYKRLWKLLIDKDMTKTELIKKAGIRTNAIAHTGKNEGVHVEALAKICVALNWMTNNIIEEILIRGKAER